MKKIILAIVLAVMLFVIVGCNSPKEVKVEATLTIDSTELILSDYNYFEMWNETGCLGRNYTNEIDKLIVSEKMMTIYRKDGIIIVSKFNSFFNQFSCFFVKHITRHICCNCNF